MFYIVLSATACDEKQGLLLFGDTHRFKDCCSPMQAEAQPVEDTTTYGTPQDPQADSVEAPAPVVAPRPPPMTTQEIAAYRSGEDPDFDPVERRGWWEVNLAAGGCPPPTPTLF